MRDHSQWSFRIGRWGGVEIRLHLFFLLFAAFTLYLSWLAAQEPRHQAYVWIGMTSLAILLLAAAAHEVGHVWAAQRLGCDLSQVVVWPLGGLTTLDRPREPQTELLVYAAGPLMNLGIAATCVPLLLVDDPGHLLTLLNPLQPTGVTEGSAWLVVMKLLFWINWVLALVNLFPTFPFDGGRILRSLLVLKFGESFRYQATKYVSIAAQFGAVGLLLAAWSVRNWHPQSLLPTWFALVVLAIFLFFSAQHERQKTPPAGDSEDLPFGYDFSQGYTSLERSATEEPSDDSGPISRWLEERREARQRKQQELEQEEDRRMDEILARISVQGLHSLTAEERLLLERVSARYRHRHGT